MKRTLLYRTISYSLLPAFSIRFILVQRAYQMCAISKTICTLKPRAMKTFVRLTLFVAVLVLSVDSHSQANANLNQGLVFKNPTLITAATTDLKVGAIYLFKGVKSKVNATVKIDSLVNGAKVNKIDDNSVGLGYTAAFQPEIKIPAGSGSSYAVFTISFQDSLTGASQVMNSVQGTAVDIDGNLLLKEMVEMDMGGGTATYSNVGLEISVLQLLVTKFRGLNVLGIEHSGLDTASTGNMYTVSKANVSSFTVKMGAVTIASPSVDRQFSLYMKGFNYANAISLPVKLVSFTATLNNNNKVDLNWVTASEINVSHFDVERSTDGVNFNQVAMVFAYGNTTENKTYSIVNDISDVKTGIVYYRLRSVDIDGKSLYSQIRIIRPGKQSDLLNLVMYPNPATSELRVTVPSAWQNKPVMLEVYSLNGQKMKAMQNSASGQTETIAVTDLANGFYLLKASCGSESVQQKFIKK
ncbi:MAG: T9SS type A sorting domain-containing protein [Bacteroidetes bacterium]|nr:MAG: T9SS type A sorting domain-containing protein [Bacteroidota bacterium]